MNEVIISDMRNQHLICVADYINSLIASVKAISGFSEAEVYKVLTPKLLGYGTAAATSAAFVDTDGQGLQLVYKDEGVLKLMSNLPVVLGFTWQEINCLYFMLKCGNADMFMSNKEKDELISHIETYMADVGREPYDYMQEQELWGRSSDSDADDKSVIEIVGTVAAFIRDKRCICYDYNTRDGISSFTVKPIAIAFSPLDERFYLKAVGRDGEHNIRMRGMHNIKACKTIEVNQPSTEMFTLSLLAIDGKNTVERITSRFSGYDRTVCYKDGRDFPYRIDIKYPSSDKHRVALRMLSFGGNIRILSGEIREQVQHEARKALARYKA